MKTHDAELLDALEGCRRWLDKLHRAHADALDYAHPDKFGQPQKNGPIAAVLAQIALPDLAIKKAKGD